MKLLVWLFFISNMMIMNVASVRALTIETQDNPISYKIEILPWEQVNNIIPKKSYFTIIDVETGMQFNVQRRAGSKHADVQPLTFEDTKIMKTIYDGKWSWKRRSILILTKDQMLAASMHGMPHGAGALKNGFPGHFCVHFYGSTTHGSGQEDLSHKLMILRAGGKLQNYLNEIDPIQVVNVLETAINQGDRKTIDMIVLNGKKEIQLHNKLKKIFLVSFDKKSMKKEVQDDLLIQPIHLKATIYKHDNSRENKDIDFVLWKDVVSGQWVIDSEITNEL